MSRDLSRGRQVVGDGEQVGESCTAPHRFATKGGRGREGEPLEWTGAVDRLECVTEGKPGCPSMTAVPSMRKRAEVIGAQAAEKSL